jgi:hypothetical protein
MRRLAGKVMGRFAMVAEIGRYTGKSSGEPPGPTVIARRLEHIGIGAEMLHAIQRK